MRAAFCGKGGSGKTTITAMFTRYLASKKIPIIVMDGDINQHLGLALGLSETELKNLPKLGNEIKELQNYVKGENENIESADSIIKTTPPGRGSNLFYFDKPNEIFSKFQKTIDGLRFMAVGGFSEDKLGTTCFHSWTAAMNIFLNHLIDGENEFFVGDMTAGADPFTTGLITRFDIAFVIIEPTMKSLSVYDQCKEYGAPFGINVNVIANKIESQQDIDFIRERVGDDLKACIYKSQFVRNYEMGKKRPIEELEDKNKEALEAIFTVFKNAKRDWDNQMKNNLEFHKRASESWASAVYESDLKKQIDESFSYKEAAATRK